MIFFFPLDGCLEVIVASAMRSPNVFSCLYCMKFRVCNKVNSSIFIPHWHDTYKGIVPRLKNIHTNRHRFPEEYSQRIKILSTTLNIKIL